MSSEVTPGTAARASRRRPGRSRHRSAPSSCRRRRRARVHARHHAPQAERLRTEVAAAVGGVEARVVQVAQRRARQHEAVGATGLEATHDGEVDVVYPPCRDRLGRLGEPVRPELLRARRRRGCRRPAADGRACRSTARRRRSRCWSARPRAPARRARRPATAPPDRPASTASSGSISAPYTTSPPLGSGASPMTHCSLPAKKCGSSAAGGCPRGPGTSRARRPAGHLHDRPQQARVAVAPDLGPHDPRPQVVDAHPVGRRPARPRTNAVAPGSRGAAPRGRRRRSLVSLLDRRRNERKPVEAVWREGHEVGQLTDRRERHAADHLDGHVPGVAA